MDVLCSQPVKERFLYNDYLFRFDKRSRLDADLIFWRCLFVGGCKARIHTKLGEVVKVSNSHSHNVYSSKNTAKKTKTIKNARKAKKTRNTTKKKVLVNTFEKPLQDVNHCSRKKLTKVPRKRSDSTKSPPPPPPLGIVKVKDENSCELFTGVSSMVNSFTLNSFCEAMEADKQVSEKDMADNSSGNSTLDFKLRQSEFMEAQKQQAEFMEAQKQQAEFMEAQKQQAEFLEAQKQAEILAEERQQRLNDSKVYKYMVLNHEKKILDTLRTLWKGNQFCDATLQNECVSIPVHKILLIACCPKILDTYDYIMKDTNVQVCFPRKVSAEALRVFVDYLYSGSLNLSRSTLDSIEYLSGMLGLDDIRQLCNQFRLDLINNAANVPDKTIVSVSHSQSSSGLRLSLSNPPATPPPPIVRLSSQSTLHSSTTSTTTTTGTVQFPSSSSPSHSSSSRYQGNRSYSQKVCDNRVSAFPDPGRDIVLLNSIKLEPEVDLTVDECTQVKQEVIPYQSSEQFRSWSANMDSHSDDSSSHCKTTDSHNFEVTTTVDLSETTLKPYSDNSHNTDNSHKSAGRDDLQSVISISPSNSPLHSPASLDSPPPSPPPHHIHTFDDVDSGSLPKGDSSPYPVGLVLANSYNNLTENNRKKKTTFDEDFDATEFSCKKSKITLEL